MQQRYERACNSRRYLTLILCADPAVTLILLILADDTKACLCNLKFPYLTGCC